MSRNLKVGEVKIMVEGMEATDYEMQKYRQASRRRCTRTILFWCLAVELTAECSPYSSPALNDGSPDRDIYS